MLTSGFFNSRDGDRTYGAEQMGQIFDGIIQDGVYETVGNHFQVTPGDGMSVYVASGRAWFNHAWVYNDSRYPLTLDAAETGLNRIDLVVLEINHNEDTREGLLKVLTGVPGANPVEPEIVETDGVRIVPLASIYVGAGVVGIAASAITNLVGTSRCPFVIGVLEIMTIDQIVTQWDAERDEMTAEQKAEFRAWMNQNEDEFDTWFQHLHDELDSNQAANLQRQIDELTAHVDDSDMALSDRIDAIRPMTSEEVDLVWNSIFGKEV